MSRLRKMLSTAVVAACLSIPAWSTAQEKVIPLDTLKVEVSSAASSELGATTRSVEVIEAESIRRSPASNIPDLLHWAAGLDLMARSPALADVSLRGSSFEQVLVLVDGVRVSDAQTGHFDLDLAVPLDQVERIEILRGAASSLHGADAMGGVINIVTRREAQGLAARIEAGSFGTAGATLSYGGLLGSIHTDVAGEIQRGDGHRPGTDYRTGIARVGVRAPLVDSPIRADFAFAARDFGAEGFYGPYPSFEETRATTASLAWSAPVPGISIDPVLSYRRHDDDFVLLRDDPQYYRNQHATIQFGGEVMARLQDVAGFQVAAGVEAYSDRLRSASLGDREAWRAAALAEIAAGSVGATTATAGLRGDVHDRYGTVWSPSLAAAWWPTERVRLRASGGRSFRAPTWTELYYEAPDNIGDPDLEPERAWSTEAGIEAMLPAGIRASLTGHLREAEDLIDWARPKNAVDGPYRTRNVQSARFRGVEAEIGLEGPFETHWTGRGSWLSVESSAETGFDSKYALRPLVEILSLSVDRTVAGIGISLQGMHARRAGEDPYHRIDGRISYTLDAMRIYADAQNLTDRAYDDIVGYPAPGRSLLVGLEWRPEQ